MGIARRAKGLREEATGLGHHATEEDVNGFLKRAEGLKDDAASVKAVQGIKVSSRPFDVDSTDERDLRRRVDNSHQ
jgi:hypothetical protein